jgi:hypothetical protein
MTSDPILAYYDEGFLGMIGPQDLALFRYVESPVEALGAFMAGEYNALASVHEDAVRKLVEERTGRAD